MAGYNETGTDRKEYKPNAARAFCEGFNARVATLLPVNPYLGTVHVEEQAAWAAGRDAAAELAGSETTRQNCRHCATLAGQTVPSAP